MTVGELYLESLSTGVITPSELSWLTHGQDRFSRLEEATALRLGRLLDQGDIQLGCRLPSISPLETASSGLFDEWIEPLGRQRHR
ncbi:hypothetical protein [Synechococcus sp. CCY 9618]|uniref:hypothetical protein n=1 Tax=Synechococcus sp. CCY 9618 TaxID=2815602 RepID=UPI001C231C4C|nr:hypothetical protein [Synechococcus sp. CCY 9618]